MIEKTIDRFIAKFPAFVLGGILFWLFPFCSLAFGLCFLGLRL